MALQYDPTKVKHATPVDSVSMTEPEHLESCDINKMVRDAARGIQVRGSSRDPVFGHDDTTMDGVQFRILKEETERNLSDLARQNEFSPDELKHMPAHVQKKFGFKTKKAPKPDPALNDDDKTTTKKADLAPKPDPVPKGE